MFDVSSSEVIILGVVALLVIPPKDLPKAMRSAGYWVGRVRGIATQFRSGFDSMVREAELHEMEKKWAAENERIMREHPPTPVQMLPSADSVPNGEEGEAEPHMVAQPVVQPAHELAGPVQPETTTGEPPVPVNPHPAGEPAAVAKHGDETSPRTVQS
ncbi:Sec-independent protein translocase subunit TatA/TatB [Sphingomonas echinoides]|uniref:Sec-independent protein translocase subunit TatA/TatB n=1 Tax=Sphingomonas echinoides TaxID=59803 RepID=UPI0024130D5E|nr:twin-arginine translocase subunit TatB [Sphingomonas echinoides]